MKPLPRNGQAVITIKDGVVIRWEAVPPHGRLIDADEAKEALRRAEFLAFGYHYAIQTINEVPTIIEAEEAAPNAESTL